MAPDIRQETAGSSCDSQVSCLAARAYQQRVNEICKAAEYNFSPEIFRIVKVIHRRPRVVYKLEDLIGTPIDDQFYQHEWTPFVSTVGRIITYRKYWIRKSDAEFVKFSSTGKVTVRILTRGYFQQV